MGRPPEITGLIRGTCDKEVVVDPKACKARATEYAHPSAIFAPYPAALVDMPVRAWQIPIRRSWRHSGQMIEAEGACG